MSTAASYLRIRQSGLTLVELMIAMTLGLVLLLGVVNVFLAQRQGYRINEELAQLQASGRVAFELMAREIRQAGVNLCGAGIVGNVVVAATGDPWLDWDAGGLEGYDGDVAMPVVATGTDEAERVDETDGIILRSAALLGGAIIAGHASSSDPIVVNSTVHGFNAGDVAVACDYKEARIFQVTGASTTSAEIAHETGSETPGNCDPGFPLNCTSGGPSHTFARNGFVAPLAVSAWYIGNNSQGGRSLFRILNDGTPQEIAQGISDLQIQYLTRTSNSPHTDYRDASDPDFVASPPWPPAASETVIAVRITLKLESNNAVGADGNVLERDLIYVVSRRGYREIL